MSTVRGANDRRMRVERFRRPLRGRRPMSARREAVLHGACAERRAFPFAVVLPLPSRGPALQFRSAGVSPGMHRDTAAAAILP